MFPPSSLNTPFRLKVLLSKLKFGLTFAKQHCLSEMKLLFLLFAAAAATLLSLLSVEAAAADDAKPAGTNQATACY